jgi:hypothetical protein
MTTTEERIHAIRAAIADSKRANSPDERDRLERAAIDAWKRIAVETGLDAMLLNRAMRDANESKLVTSPVELNDLGEPDFGKDNDERAYLWAVLASFLNDLRVGFFRTKAGKTIIHAAKSMSDGTGSFFAKAPTRQGVDVSSEDREALYFSVVSYAAAYDALKNCGIRTAIHVAAGEYGMHAEGVGRMIDPEALRQRVNRPTDKLAKHYQILLRELRKPGGREAVVQAHQMLQTDPATIRVETSVSETD